MTAASATAPGSGPAARAAMLDAALPDHLARRTWSREQLAVHQRDGLRALLSTAINHSPFHARRLRDLGVDLQHVELAELTRLPTMTKTDMMACFDEVVTDRRLTRRVLEAHLAATGSEATELFDEFTVLASGGSTGERGMFVYDRAAFAHYTLGIIRDIRAVLPPEAQQPAGGLPTTMVGSGSGMHGTRATTSIFGTGPLAITQVPASLPLAEIVARLNAAPPQVLIGYASMLGLLAEERRAGRLRISPLAVSGTAEPFPPALRSRVADAFGVEPADMYATSEGVAARSAPGQAGHVLTADLAIVELVDADNQLVPPGVESDKVLVTNLYNHTQPLIRYELRDRMRRLPADPGHGHPRVAIAGRAEDVLVYPGVVVHPIVVLGVLEADARVAGFQLTQTAHGVHVDVLAPTGAPTGGPTGLAEELTRALAAAGMPDPQVTVATVPELARHPQTGKLARIRAGLAE